jgi:hypothetical protein
MSTNVTAEAEAPSSPRRSDPFSALTATITGSPAATPSRTKGTVPAKNSEGPS